jgi:transposase
VKIKTTIPEAAKRGRGRPRKSPDEKRVELLTIRRTEDEIATWTAAAHTAGLTVAEWARELLTRAADTALKGGR